MPARKRSSRSVSYRRRRMRGGSLKSILNFAKKANSFLRRTKLLSRAGRLGDKLGVPLVGKVGSLAGKLGYGRRVRMYRRGGALKLSGSGRRMRPRYITY